jgi:cytochrome c oxidase cbb3-type subunit 3
MSNEIDQDKLLDHNYDGIQEYDNPMPRWWLAVFYITIVFSVFYTLYFHFGPGLLVAEAYNRDMAAYYELQAQQLAALGEINESTLTEVMQNPSMMAGAQALFQTKCSQCHGMAGEGGIGPNLTDDYWLHGGNLVDIYHTVSEGVTAKGMLAWKNQLPPAELLAVSSYVGTLRGTTPANPKDPQGELQPYDPDAAGPEEPAEEG